MVIQALVDVQSPEAAVIVLVRDNRTTHPPASVYAGGPPAAAKRLADKRELPAPPNHGSGLTRAEIEVPVLAARCLDRRLADRARLERAVAAWEARRTAARQPIDRRFTTAAARSTLQHLSPALHDGLTTSC